MTHAVNYPTAHSSALASVCPLWHVCGVKKGGHTVCLIVLWLWPVTEQGLWAKQTLSWEEDREKLITFRWRSNVMCYMNLSGPCASGRFLLFSTPLQKLLIFGGFLKVRLICITPQPHSLVHLHRCAHRSNPDDKIFILHKVRVLSHVT